MGGSTAGPESGCVREAELSDPALSQQSLGHFLLDKVSRNTRKTRHAPKPAPFPKHHMHPRW